MATMSEQTPVKRVRTRHFAKAKADGLKITGLTAYDAPSATVFDRAGVDLLLVGDSAANVILGYDSTLPITVDELITMTRSVTRATQRAFVVADMPFGSYEESTEHALQTAVRFMKEAGAHGVKLEGGVRMRKQIRRITEAGIPCSATSASPRSRSTTSAGTSSRVEAMLSSSCSTTRSRCRRRARSRS